MGVANHLRILGAAPAGCGSSPQAGRGTRGRPRSAASSCTCKMNGPKVLQHEQMRVRHTSCCTSSQSSPVLHRGRVALGTGRRTATGREVCQPPCGTAVPPSLASHVAMRRPSAPAVHAAVRKEHSASWLVGNLRAQAEARGTQNISGCSLRDSKQSCLIQDAQTSLQAPPPTPPRPHTANNPPGTNSRGCTCG